MNEQVLLFILVKKFVKRTRKNITQLLVLPAGLFLY